MWVKQPTAILVIHGVGEQNPFDTLDSFTRTLLPVLEAEAKKDGHALVRRHDYWLEEPSQCISESSVK